MSNSGVAAIWVLAIVLLVILSNYVIFTIRFREIFGGRPRNVSKKRVQARLDDLYDEILNTKREYDEYVRSKKGHVSGDVFADRLASDHSCAEWEYSRAREAAMYFHKISRRSRKYPEFSWKPSAV